MTGAVDEADKNAAGKLSSNPREGTKLVAAKVPRVLTVRDILATSMHRALSKDRASTFTTGHYRIDNITGGMRSGFTWLVGADTSWGKSSWLIAVADENLKAGKRVLIVSSEDTEEVYGDRLMVRRARVDALAYRDQKLNREDIDKVTAVAAVGEALPVYVDARRWPIEELEPHLAAIIREQKIDIVAFDYVQEFQSKRRHQDERVKFREIASVCRHTAKNAKIAGMIFSQLTLDDKTRIPNRRNIRECRDIANAAEVILIGFEPEEDILEPDTKRLIVAKNTKCIFVDKVKNGPRGAKVPMKWDATSACFDTVKDPERQRYDEIVGDQFDDFAADEARRFPDK